MSVEPLPRRISHIILILVLSGFTKLHAGSQFDNEKFCLASGGITTFHLEVNDSPEAGLRFMVQGKKITCVQLLAILMHVLHARMGFIAPVSFIRLFMAMLRILFSILPDERFF